MHFLYLEPCETDKKVLKSTKKFGSENSLLAPGSPAFVQGDHSSWKVMEFSKTIFQAWKVMENSQGHGKSSKVMEKDDDVLDYFVKMH